MRKKLSIYNLSSHNKTAKGHITRLLKIDHVTGVLKVI